MLNSIRMKYELSFSSTKTPSADDSSTYEEPVKNIVDAHFKKAGLTNEPHILLGYGGATSTSSRVIVGFLLPISDLRQITNGSVQKLNTSDTADTTNNNQQSHLYCVYFKRYSRSHLEYLIRFFANNAVLPGSGFTVKSVSTDRNIHSFSVEHLYNYQVFENWNALQLLCYCYSDGENLKELITFLFNHCGIEPAMKTATQGYNALHLLCRYYRGRESFLIVIKFLVNKCGIEPKAKSKIGWDDFLLLCHFYQKDDLREILDYFVQQGCGMNGVDINFRRSAFISVCRSYRGRDLKLVLELLLSFERK